MRWGTPALRTLPVTDWSCTDVAMALAVEVITLGVRRCKSQQRMQPPTRRPRLESATGLNYYVKCLLLLKHKETSQIAL